MKDWSEKKLADEIATTEQRLMQERDKKAELVIPYDPGRVQQLEQQLADMKAELNRRLR